VYVGNQNGDTVYVITDSTNTISSTINIGLTPVEAAYDSAKKEVFVVNKDSDNISVINDTTNAVIATISTGTTPSGITYDVGKGEIFVSNEGSNNVSVISDSTNTIVATISVGSAPEGIAYDSGKGYVYVSNNGGNTVSVIADSTNTVTATVSVGLNPTGITYDSGKGEVFVSNGASNNVSVISDSTNTVSATITVGSNPTAIVYDSGKGEVFVSNEGSNNLSVISDSTNTVSATISVGTTPLEIAYDSAKGELYVGNQHSGTVSVISDSTNTVIATVSVGLDPVEVVYDSSKGEVYVVNEDSHTISIISDTDLIASGGDYSLSHPVFAGSEFESNNLYPLYIDEKGIALPQYSNLVPTTVLHTGTPATIRIEAYDAQGPQSVEHVALFADLPGNDTNISDSHTQIVWEKGQPLKVIDPLHLFNHVNVISVPKGNLLELDYNVTFAKQMPTSSIIIRMWNQYRSSTDVQVLDAIRVLPTANTIQVLKDQVQNKTETTSTQQADMMTVVKEWGGYLPQSISDSQMLNSMGFKGDHTPSWLMKTTKWVVDGSITLQDFENAIEYLHDAGIIK
jgi:YVTN family beta-propeller protein